MFYGKVSTQPARSERAEPRGDLSARGESSQPFEKQAIFQNVLECFLRGS